MGWVAGRHQKDLIQHQLEMGLFGKNEMPDMDGVKGPTKDCDALTVGVPVVTRIMDGIKPIAAIGAIVP